MRFLSKVLLSSVIFGAYLEGLAAAPLPVIKEVRYEGLNYISPLIANEIAKIKTGEAIDIRQVNQAILDFYQQGYFKDIWVLEDNGVLTFHFIEKPVIASLVISGYGAGKDQEVLDKEVGLKKGDVYDEMKVNEAKKRIMNLLETKGYYDTIIETKTEEIGPNALKLTLEVNQGEEIIIRKANYYGRENLKVSRIEAFTANKEREFLGWMWGFNSGKLQIAEIETDSLRIQDLYMQKGYLDAKVSKPFLRTDFTTYNAELDYYIEEGQSYKVMGVDIVLEEPVIDEKELYDLVKSKDNKTFNINTMRKDAESIKFKIGDLGYAFAKVTPDLDKNTEDSTVRIIYYVQPGKKVKINDVIISGNSKTLDRVIRRNVLLAPGDQYEMSKIPRSKNAIMRSGGFDSVDIQERRVDEEKVDLLVNVKEAKTGEFTFGVGYGSYDGIMGSASIKDRNIFGTGLTSGLYFDKSEVSTSYRLNLYNPAVLDSDYSLSTDIYQTDYVDYDYREITTGFSIVGGRRITDTLEANIGYTWQQSELSEFTNPIYSQYYLGQYSKSSIIPGLYFDNTDSYYFPKNGWKASASVEYAGVGGDAKFLKYFGTLYYFKSLEDYMDIDLVFRFRSKLGLLQDNGYLPINEKFYLGGVSSIRGYQTDSITPRDKRGARIGGKQTSYTTIELSYGLFETVPMRVSAFYDYGLLGENDITQIQRSSVGVALEWISPIGAITFIIPKALNSKPGDDTSSFEFTMGQRF
ncbi:outer membrane protein assembly factor BamA [Helicobacter valdiviensis]|uniref:Outer membrane protein assembly factor BamA n=1 Tax=Helicobacter valdiviensis TaxID=1458358 RepID=A0A2W6MWH5_9HELI|nr:outer membrane protein assembly factor BamA [Helicobacter valdiviensis]PZT48875.1 outer membrane protein assembly factor BamA [Helicobacter valdiviensis]